MKHKKNKSNNYVKPIYRLVLFIALIFFHFKLDSIYYCPETEISNQIAENNSPKPATLQIYHQNTTGFANDVYIDGNYAYIADGTSGLAIIDISDPTNPGSPIYQDTDGFSMGVAVQDGFAFVADQTNGLAIINVTDPTDPNAPNNVATTSSSNEIAINGQYAYIAHASGFDVIDISEPTNPGSPLLRSTSSAIKNLCINNSLIYIATAANGLAVFNATNAATPSFLAYESMTGMAMNVAVKGHYAFLAEYETGLAIINTLDPSDPQPPSYLSTEIHPFSIVIVEDFAFLPIDNGKLAIINISNPLAPGDPQYLQVGSYANDIWIQGDFAYLACGEDGLAVLNISSYLNPVNDIPNVDNPTENEKTQNPNPETTPFNYQIFLAVIFILLGIMTFFLLSKYLKKTTKYQNKSQYESGLLKKFESIMLITNRVKKEEVAKSLGLSLKQFFEYLVKWSEKISFKIEGDEIVVNNTADFVNQLDYQFRMWENNEK